MAKEKDYWFKPRSYGLGWGIPQKWQGWVSFGVFVAVWLLALAILTPSDDKGISPSRAVLFVVIMGLDMAGMLYVSFKHGDAPAKWHWKGKTRSTRKG
jgi:hypothetical protein